MTAENVKYVGVNDHEIDLFEGQYDVPLGMAYNSYAIIDDRIAIVDSVEKNFSEEWLNNIKTAIGDKTPSYLIVQHMEPDHSSSITAFLSAYPDALVVASQKAFVMMKNFYGIDLDKNAIAVSDGSTLALGKTTLSFITAPMVHWPEVIMTYEPNYGTLFSADAFGKFGANDIEDDDGWTCEARRYYFGIVGKYGIQVQAVLKKASALNVKTICPLHGPVLDENLDYYLGIYDTWSSYKPEDEGVLIAYTSVYGNTQKAVEILAEKLKEYGCPKVAVTDLARDDMAEAVEDAFRYEKIVLATTTYNTDIFPFMRTFIDALTERNYQNRTVGFIENGSWAPTATKVMKGLLEKSKNLTYTEAGVKIISAVSECNLDEIDALAKELCLSYAK